MEAGDLEIVGIDQSDDVPVVSDDVINEMVPDISDSGTISFSKGVHNVNIELITYGGVSAGPLGASFGKTVISFNGQKIESLGGSTGAGLGTDFFSSVKSSTIEFHTEISGNSLADIFNLTGLITTRTIGGMVKFGEVIGFDGPNTMNKLWSARVFGAGLSAGVEGVGLQVNLEGHLKQLSRMRNKFEKYLLTMLFSLSLFHAIVYFIAGYNYEGYGFFIHMIMMIVNLLLLIRLTIRIWSFKKVDKESKLLWIGFF